MKSLEKEEIDLSRKMAKEEEEDDIFECCCGGQQYNDDDDVNSKRMRMSLFETWCAR